MGEREVMEDDGFVFITETPNDDYEVVSEGEDEWCYVVPALPQSSSSVEQFSSPTLHAVPQSPQRSSKCKEYPAEDLLSCGADFEDLNPHGNLVEDWQNYSNSDLFSPDEDQSELHQNPDSDFIKGEDFNDNRISFALDSLIVVGHGCRQRKADFLGHRERKKAKRTYSKYGLHRLARTYYF